YTSGTTGTPKGVMVTHGAVARFHDWVHDFLGASAEDRFLQTSPLSFGGSIRQIYSALLAGASIHPAPRGMTRDPAALLAFLERERITIFKAVPVLFRKLEEALDDPSFDGAPPRLEHLRLVLLGGEHVTAGPVRRWMDRFGLRHRIVNLYGSTETIVNATYSVVRERPSDAASAVPI